MRNNDETVFVAAVILVLFVAFGISALLGKQESDKNREVVKAVCDYSRGVKDGKAEKLCGDVQDKTNTEYLCDTKGQCKVESKS